MNGRKSKKYKMEGITIANNTTSNNIEKDNEHDLNTLQKKTPYDELSIVGKKRKRPVANVEGIKPKKARKIAKDVGINNLDLPVTSSQFKEPEDSTVLKGLLHRQNKSGTKVETAFQQLNVHIMDKNIGIPEQNKDINTDFSNFLKKAEYEVIPSAVVLGENNVGAGNEQLDVKEKVTNIESVPKKSKNEMTNEHSTYHAFGDLETTLNNSLNKQEVNIIDIKDEKFSGSVNENVVTISIQDVEESDSDLDENVVLRQLEKKVEKKNDSHKASKGITWPEEDLKELISRMEVRIPEKDSLSFSKRLEKLEWDKILFKNYSVEDCKKTWAQVQKQVRKVRLLQEVLQDAKIWVDGPKAKKVFGKTRKCPDMPRRPLTAYFIYYLKKKDYFLSIRPGMDATEMSKICSQEFKKLPPKKREKYEKLAAKSKEEYEEKLREFYETHPEVPTIVKGLKRGRPAKTPKISEKPPTKDRTPKRAHPPFHYYYLSEVEKDTVEDKVGFKDICKEQWKQLSDKKKMEWIRFAEAENLKFEEEVKEYVKNHPDYVQNPHKSVLTKTDMQLKEKFAGKPTKPPCSSYNLFASMLLQSEEIKNVPVKDRLVFVSNQWKLCSEDEKKEYKDLYDKMNQKYKLDYKLYLDSLPEDERKIELEKTLPKRRKSEDRCEKAETIKKRKSEKPKPEKEKLKKTIGTKPVKKNLAKIEKKINKFVEPEQPPISPFKYFVTLYTGEEPAANAWKALSLEQKKKYELELIEKKKIYITDFEKFLKSLSKEQLEAFSNARRKIKRQEQEEAEEEESSEDSDTDNSPDEVDH